MAKPNFADFRYNGDVSERTLATTLNARESTYARASTGFDSDQGEQRLAVYMTSPSRLEGPEVIMRMSPFSDDPGRPEGRVMDAYLAEETGRRIMMVGSPSVDFSAWANPDYHDESQLTPEQIEELREKGSFKKTGAAVMRAGYNAALEFGIEDPEIVISTSSMGSALVPGAVNAALEDGMALRGLALGETVNHVARPLPLLMAQFAMQNFTAPGYLAMNPQPLQDVGESMGYWLKRTYEARSANWSYARALGAGTFYADLEGIDGLAQTDMDVPVLLMRGGGSRLSPAGAHHELVDFFSEVTEVQSVEYAAPHDHALTMTERFMRDSINGVLRMRA